MRVCMCTLFYIAVSTIFECAQIFNVMGISMRISIMFMVRLDTWQRHVQCITVVTQFSNKLITYLLLWNFSSSSCVILDAQLLFHYASYCIIMFFQTYNDFFYKDNSFLLLYCIWYFKSVDFNTNQNIGIF